MKIEVKRRKDGNHEVWFTLSVSDPEIVCAPRLTVRGMDHDASVHMIDGYTEINGDPPTWYAFILSIVDNQALVQAIRNQYAEYLAEAAEDNA